MPAGERAGNSKKEGSRGKILVTTLNRVEDHVIKVSDGEKEDTQEHSRGRLLAGRKKPKPAERGANTGLCGHKAFKRIRMLDSAETVK